MADERPARDEPVGGDRGDAEDAHQRAVTRDRVYMRRLDEQEVRARAVDAFDRFTEMGFTAHLIAVQVRGAVEYRIALYPDGQRTFAVDVIREVATEFNFDLQMEQDPHYEGGWSILLYPLS